MPGHCGRDACRCTHDCDYGWLNLPPHVMFGKPYDRVAPCPVCRPEAHTRYETKLRYESRPVR